ncbi:enoyl-CoA hydratase-related protein [Halobacterium sp. R2-5]|uniref:enoyl-CoA hydratase/isomerase family protein n=1 Tax=Halobacterium sp. R2-5 TaxID=2715751 RepID=UPI0014201F73|nr:enoyl-CoA hydratase-related protein [Halobacterium sp. R2-5]NIB98779.1 enoyl-CoA hydratase/isomerase family protein [Halobacterium sp. R2-5]
MADTVRFDIEDDVATITVDRPESLNALNVETLQALHDAVDEAEAEEARVLVLTGAGDDAFVAGADISYMAEMDSQEAHEYAELGHDLADAIESFPAPVVAAINGYAFGGGMELALACDLRVASETAVLGQTEIDLGIIPGWGATQRLPRLVDDETARRLIYFGDRLDATDAHEEGIVGDVVAHDELDDHVASLAADLAAKSRTALRAAKDAINQSHETPLDAGLDYERRTWAGLFGSHDQREGMAAFLEDRDPDFE